MKPRTAVAAACVVAGSGVRVPHPPMWKKVAVSWTSAHAAIRALHVDAQVAGRPLPADAEPAPRAQPVGFRFDVREVLDVVSDKWSLYVVANLGGGPRRFTELKRALDGVSQKMLTLTLRHLERDGLLTPHRLEHWQSGADRGRARSTAETRAHAATASR